MRQILKRLYGLIILSFFVGTFGLMGDYDNWCYNGTRVQLLELLKRISFSCSWSNRFFYFIRLL